MPGDRVIQWPARRELWFLALLALVPILGYQFGIGNQVEQFSLIERVLDPSFIPGDFFIDSSVGFGPRYYFVRVVAAVASATSVPVAVLLLAVASNFALAVVTFAAARTLLAASTLGGALAATFAITNAGFALGLAAFVRFDSFQPANLAVPLGLAGLLLILARSRLWLGVVFLTLSSMMHPLIGAEMAALVFVSAGLTGSRSERRELIPPAILGAFLIAAVWAGPGLLWPAPAEPAANLFDIMASFRAPHHYLARSFPIPHYLAFGLFLGAGWLLARRHLRDHGWTAGNRALALMALGVLALCVGSAYFVDLRHASLWVMAQPFRMLLLVKWIGFLLVGTVLARVIATDHRLGWTAATAVLLAPGEVLGAMLLLAAGITAWPPGARHRHRVALCFAFGAVALLAIWRLGTVTDVVRPGAAVIALAAFVTVRTRRGPILATLGLAVLLVIAVAHRSADTIPLKAFQPTFTWSDVVTPAADAARWARANTAEGSVWVIPPEIETFRLLAHRAVVVDFTSIPLSNGGMTAWRERITAVYGEVTEGGFAGLRQMQAHWRVMNPEGLARAASRFGATHALLYAETPWNGAVLFQNASYKIVAL